MNWLDIVIILIVIASAVIGMRAGLSGAALTAFGAFVGWLLAGRFGDDVGGIFEESLSNDTIVTVVSYVIIIVAVMVTTNVMGRIIRPFLLIATLGLGGIAAKTGSLVFGFVVGLVISGALITAMARLSYDFELPEKGIAVEVATRIPNIESSRETVESALVGSTIVPIFVDFVDTLPANALGFIPSDFKVPLDILQEKIEGRSVS